MRTGQFCLFFIVFTCVTSALTSGCATQQQPMYYWGGYSNSLYCCRIASTEENLLKHKQILENIVEESAKRNLRVPPGVCAELGYIYFRQNNSQEAIKYFELEERTYPESKVLMQRLTQATKARTDQK